MGAVTKRSKKKKAPKKAPGSAKKVTKKARKPGPGVGDGLGFRRKRKKSAPRRVGRPAILEDPVQNKIVTTALTEAVRASNYLEIACVYAGLSKQSVYDWMRRGAREKRDGATSVYTEFLDAVKKAEAAAEVADVLAIGTAGKSTVDRPGQWQALAWRLERRHPKRWGRKDSALTFTELRQLMEELARVVERCVEDPDVVAAIRHEWREMALGPEDGAIDAD